ncbi:uncharacterized protein LOC135503282 [Lineus longissimus]|uniref:uncharacterized protein LOC135503282 n=1 Tax=Lineus longissimus TaxID=88925 RepID=UPI002B4DC3F5
MKTLIYNAASVLVLVCAAALAENQKVSCVKGDPVGQCVPKNECGGQNRLEDRRGCKKNERCCLLCHSGKPIGQCVSAAPPAKCKGKEKLNGRAGCANNQICCEPHFNEDCTCSYSPASDDHGENGIAIRDWCRPWPECRLQLTQYVL